MLLATIFQDFNLRGMEGGIHKAESTEFRDLLYLTSKQPFILRLAFSAGIGGLLFGYDTGPSSKLSTCLCAPGGQQLILNALLC